MIGGEHCSIAMLVDLPVDFAFVNPLDDGHFTARGSATFQEDGMPEVWALGEKCHDGLAGFSFSGRRWCRHFKWLHCHFKSGSMPADFLITLFRRFRPPAIPAALSHSLGLLLVKGRGGVAAIRTQERAAVPFGWFLRRWYAKLLEDFLGFRMFHSA